MKEGITAGPIIFGAIGIVVMFLPLAFPAVVGGWIWGLGFFMMIAAIYFGYPTDEDEITGERI